MGETKDKKRKISELLEAVGKTRKISIQIKFKGQGHRSVFRVTGENSGYRNLQVNVYTAGSGGLWRMKLNYDGNVLLTQWL